MSTQPMPSNSKPSYAELAARVQQLEAEKAAKQRVWFKIGEKGGVSIYGINSRFPVTLYGDQWDRLLSHADELKQFMDANRSKLTTKQ